MSHGARDGTIISIQILRALAAIAVAVSHAAQNLDRFAIAPNTSHYFLSGAAGVDLFFVISGFVMVYASEPLFGSSSGALAFISHRTIRIVPLYWLVTAFYAAFATLIPGLGTAYPVRTVAASFLFIPTPLPDGSMHPVVGQGWTLNYEMFFYAIFAVAVLAPRRLAVVLATTALILAVLIGRLVAPLAPAMSFWTDSIVLEFVFGMIIGLGYRQGTKINPVFGVALVIVGFAGLALTDFDTLAVRPRFLAWGAPAALVVTGATFGRFSLRNRTWQALAVVGNASYALYLLHTFALRALVPVTTWLSFHMTHWLWIYFCAAIVVPVLVALPVHYGFEQPVTKALRRYATVAKSWKPRSANEALPAEWAAGKVHQRD
jgi:exopolysaccharide production protein ExoZ